MISFEYKSLLQRDNGGYFFLGEYIPNGRILTDMSLEKTRGDWRQVCIVTQLQGKDSVTMVPLIRNWSLGSIWFDNVEVR